VAACVFLGALAGAWLLWRELSQLQSQLTAASSRQMAVDASIAQARNSIAAQKVSLARAREAAPAGEHPTATASNSGGKRGKVSVNALLEADPKLMALYLKSFRANLPDRYWPLFQSLGLTWEQFEKWEDVRTANEAKLVDLRDATAEQGLPYTTDQGIAAMKKQIHAQGVQEMADALGATVAQQLDDAMSQYPAPPNGMVAMITNITTVAAQNGAPMNYQQLGQLGTLLATNFTPNPALGGKVDWNNVGAQAATSLSGPQLDALQMAVSLRQLSDKVKQFYSAQGGSP
jgi:hypothetical protein